MLSETVEGARMAKQPAAAGEKGDLFHVVHKVPAGDSPYVRAKHLQVTI